MDVGAALAVLGPGQEAAALASARARQLRLLADDARRVARHVSGAGEIDWLSRAADAFRVQASDRAAAVMSLATQLERAADALDRHGTLVADRVAVIEETVRRAPARVRELGDGFARRVADELDEVLP